jgi:hypothetical protein
MKERFQKVGHEGFADYEMLEMRLIVQSARATQSLSPRR